MTEDSLWLDGYTTSPWIKEDIRPRLKGTRNQRPCELEHDGNPFNIVKRLKACTALRDLHEGSKLHAYVREHPCLGRITYIGNMLISMYAKCGAVAKACQVLKELPMRDVVSWTALIAGHVQQREGEEALKCFNDMLHEGHWPNAVTFICVLKACGSIRAAGKGEEIHERIASMGMLEKNIVLGNTLVDMYAKCGALDKAQQVLKEHSMRDVVSWNALIGGYTQHGQEEQALKCFDDMLQEGHSPDAVTFICILKACGSIGASAKGEEIHYKIVSLGMLEKDAVLGNRLVDMYAKCGALAKALQVLKELPTRDVVTWNALIAGHAQQGQGEEALKCFDDMLYEGHSSNAVTFVYVLKACGSIKAIAKGEEICDRILSLGILEKDVMLGNTMVDMYAKCGALAKAQKVFKELPMHDVVSWNVLMAGYAQHGQGAAALKCFYDMLHEGQSPDAVTFICALKACGSIGAAAKGEEIHDKIVNLRMLEKDVVLGTSLIDMYVKCRALGKAQRVLEELPVCDAASWNVLIFGYAQQGQGEEALKCFDDMLHEGHSPNAVTFICVLKACGSIRAVAKGEEIHEKIVSMGMLEKSLILGSTLVNMYVKCGTLAKAHQALKELPICDVVSWTALIAGHVQEGEGEDAIKCFDDMLCEGYSPNAVTFICALKACGSIGAAAKGEEIHDKIVNLGMLEKDVVLGNSLIDMYVKCGALSKAHQVLEELPVCDAVSWNPLISGYAEQGQGEKALKCFYDMLCEGHSPNTVSFICALKACGSVGAGARGEDIHDMIVSMDMLEKDVVLGNTLLGMYARCGALSKAQQLLKQLSMHDVVTWNALIAGYAQHGQGEEALKCFDDMLHEGHSPNAVTFICILKACASIGAVTKGEEIHHKIVTLGMLEKDIILGNSLIAMYVKCGALAKAQQVLEDLTFCDVVSWNTLISGYAQHGQGEEALKCFDDMLRDGHSPDAISFICVLKACGSIGAVSKGEEIHEKIVTMGMLEKNAMLGNSLVDMYAKCGKLAKAYQVLKELPVRDVVSWTAVIAGHADHGQGEEALKCFDDMLNEGHSPNAVTFVCVSKACGSIGAAAKGEDIYNKSVSLGMLEKYIVLGNSLIDMYVKCGALVKAQRLLNELPVYDAVSWNALICGYAQQGQNLEAVNCFKQMQANGVKPNLISFVIVLKACCHSGLLDQAETYFSEINKNYEIHPGLEHYCCMIDVFARAGQFNKAVCLIVEMPYDKCFSSWVVLLGACRKWTEVKIGTLAFEHALSLDKCNAAVYVLMADIYTAAGLQEQAHRVEIMRVTNKAWK